MRMLVTGAAGFIGSHLCRRLVAHGHEVVGLDDLSDGKLENLAGVPEVRVVEADLRDEDAVRVAADGCAVVYHQGAMRSVPRSIAQPERTTDVNVRGTLNVLLAARDARAGSSSHPPLGVRGPGVLPLREDMEPPAPIALRRKQVGGEAFCRSWWLSFGVSRGGAGRSEHRRGRTTSVIGVEIVGSRPVHPARG